MTPVAPRQSAVEKYCSEFVGNRLSPASLPDNFQVLPQPIFLDRGLAPWVDSAMLSPVPDSASL